MQKDRVLRAASLLLRVLIVLNLVCLAGFAVVLILSFPFDPWLAARLARKYGPALDVSRAITGLRLAAMLGLAGAVAVHLIFTGMLRIVRTVEAGDPFVDGNATELTRIGWALLALQLLDLCIGALTRWLSALDLHVAAWSPSLGGWIAVLMIFVLARVFRIGAAMRDDLATTV